MSRFRLILRSLRYHARAHLGTLLGAAVAAAVLIGALAVGDSVRGTLRELALLRLGQTAYALASGDRLFTMALVQNLQVGLTQVGYLRPGTPAPAPALLLPGVAVNADGSARANRVQVLGVDGRFWQLAPTPSAPGELPPDAVVLNDPLAAQLRARPGDTVLLRVPKPQALSPDAPLAPEEDTTVALRLRVQAVADDTQFGRFGLQANQVAPFNAFVSLRALQSRVGAADRANLLLVAEPQPLPAPQGMRAGNVLVWSGNAPFPLGEHLERVLTQRWQLADAQLEWRAVPESAALELRSPRVFLDPVVGEAVFGAAPGDTNALVARLPREFPGVTATGVLTYFVNELRVGERATPYSMVTATGPPLAPHDLAEDEILITRWLADDLQAGPGDVLTMKFYVVGAMRQLEERAATFRIRGILPMDAPGLDRDLMPDFPGMTDAENCRDWDTGLPIDNTRIRPADEAYWREYRGTPKAVIRLAAGQRLWENRFGNLTAVRFTMPFRAAPDRAAFERQTAPLRTGLSTLLTRTLKPAAFGLRFEPVRAQALAASTQAQDFGQLFLGFSFFLIAAALLLLAVLFQFTIERRATELGTLLALGFRPGQAGRLLLAEGALVAWLGAALGAWGGLGYARALLHGLSTLWREAVGGLPLRLHVEPATLGGGYAAAVLVAGLTLALALRHYLRLPARLLLAEGALENPGEVTPASPRGPAVLAGGCALGALALVGLAVARPDRAAAGLFFGAGALLLLAGLAGALAALRALGNSASTTRLSLTGMGVRAATRQPRRSLAVVGLLACGSFLVAAIGVFRLEAGRGVERRASGTGGFALIAEATQPVVRDLNAADGWEAYGLDAGTLTGVSVVPFRVRDGDEASCLNLNRAQTPRLLGVNPDLLAARGAFTFARLADRQRVVQPWLALRRGPDTPPDEVPAIGDAASIQWALGRRVGETLDFTDERGRPFKVRLVGALANSILQGSLVIDEAEFVRRFPGTAGYRFFLVDAPAERREAVAAELTRGLRDLGVEVTPAAGRLAAFNAVQNTYLGTFQVLGGLGLLLGSVGLGVVVLRNVLERRSELALLLAVGFRRRALRGVVLSEHLALLGAGLALGVLAAAVAVLPAVWAAGTEVPWVSLGVTLAAILCNGAVWTALAAESALRGELLAALRNE
jgi:putative ABC transport system permease protein